MFFRTFDKLKDSSTWYACFSCNVVIRGNGSAKLKEKTLGTFNLVNALAIKQLSTGAFRRQILNSSSLWYY
jgi:hypothetical protein